MIQWNAYNEPHADLLKKNKINSIFKMRENCV